MKKLIALLMVLAMVFALVACTAKPADKPADKPAEAGMKVALVTDVGNIDDKSFNQGAWEGVVAFCEAQGMKQGEANGVEFTYKKPTGDSTAERVSAVEAAIDEGYNVIVMPGFAFAGTIYEVQDKYPEVKFIGLDVSENDLFDCFYNIVNFERTTLIDENNPAHVAANTYCAVYQEELCGYMAGYAAVKLGYKHLGFLGGMAVPAVVRYGYGFIQGADAAAKELGIAGEVTIEYVYGNQFFGDADITAYMDTWYQTKNVEVVFACGGGIYTSAVEAAKKVEGAKVIGVDVDQAAIIANLGGEGMTVTSAMKGLAATVKATLGDVILNGNWDAYSGKVANLGLVSGEDPTANFVQIPMESTQWADGFTQDNYKELVAKMFAGEITVSNAIDAQPATEITVNVYDNIKG